MKILGLKNSVYLFNIKYILCVIWKAISNIYKDKIELNLYKSFEETLIKNNNYFDELYERVIHNVLD